MKHLDLFAGIGGFALAMKKVFKDKYENIGHSEIDKNACEVYIIYSIQFLNHEA